MPPIIPTNDPNVFGDFANWAEKQNKKKTIWDYLNEITSRQDDLFGLYNNVRCAIDPSTCYGEGGGNGNGQGSNNNNGNNNLLIYIGGGLLLLMLTTIIILAFKK